MSETRKINKVKNVVKTLLFCLLLSVITAPFQIDKVYAAHNCGHPAPVQLYGRNENCGYFLNQPVSVSGAGLLTGINDQFGAEAMLGVNDINRFVSVIRFHLQPGCNPGGGPDDSQRRNAAAFIVLTMQGAPAGTVANAPCIPGNPYHVNNWETLVRQYNAAGLIDFNADGWFVHNTRLQTSTQDIAWYNSAFGITPSIIVRAPNGSVIYMIKKNCANPIGIPGVLTSLSHSFNATPNANTTVAPNTENPTSATFSSGVSYSGAPFNGTLSWRYFILRYGSAAEELLLSGSIDGNFTGTSYNRPDTTLSVAGRNLQPGDRVCARTRIQPAAGQAGPTGDVTSVSVEFRETPNECETIVHLPYHQVFGGDTRAGSGFLNNAGNCVADTSARIIGFNRDGTPNYLGSGSQLAAFTFNTILFFSSGQLRSNATQPKPLSFANDDPSRSNFGTTAYGGGLMDGYAVCAPDHYDDGVAEATNTLGASTSANIAPATYTRIGNLTITGGNLGLGTGSRIIYVEGDVRITDNITYAGGNYNDVDHIPGFRLIVKGNIYVEPNVSQLDGIYIAQPRDTDGTRGRFYTCAPGGAAPDASEMNSAAPGGCRSTKLTIYGAVLADLIKFTRSRGTTGQSANTALLPAQDAANSAAAEVIIMTPEAWLVSDFVGSGEFDAITTLPPVL